MVTGAMELLEMKSLDDVPGNDTIPPDTWLHSECDRRKILSSFTDKFLNKFVRFRYNGDNVCGKDLVTEYEMQLLSIGLFYLEYRDGIKEGDGERVLRCWRYLLPIFLCTNRTNYAKEALNLLCQHKYLLTERQSIQLLYSRFVNTQGGRGKNVSCDLHMEHLNKVCKEYVRDLGPNKTASSIVQVSKSIGIIDSVMTVFDSENGIDSTSGSHKKVSCTDDVKMIADDLIKYKVLVSQGNRKVHPSFKKPKILLDIKNQQKLLLYMKNKIPER